eukprot:1181428-Prymnesium_polylepis.1
MHGVTIAPPPNHKPLTACDLIDPIDVRCGPVRVTCASPTDKRRLWQRALAAISVFALIDAPEIGDTCQHRAR